MTATRGLEVIGPRISRRRAAVGRARPRLEDLVGLWIAGNAYLLSRPFDPYPFILLNLAFSTQAAYAAPLILLAGNRAAQRDRLTLEHAADETDVAEKQNERLLRGNTEILEHVEVLEERILQLEQRIMGVLKPGG